MPDRPLFLLLALAFAAILIGCPSAGIRQVQSEQTQILDSMDRDARAVSDPAERQRLLDNVARLRKEIQTSHGTLEAQQRELDELRSQRERYDVSQTLKADSVEMPYFSPVATPQALDLWVIPRDAQGDAVKVAGSVKISVRRAGAFGLGASGKSLADWSLSPAQIQDKWAGQLYQGYHFLLAWPGAKRPSLKDTFVRVVFANPDGKTCSAEKPLESGD